VLVHKQQDMGRSDLVLCLRQWPDSCSGSFNPYTCWWREGMRRFEAWAERKNLAQTNKFSFLKKLLQQFWKSGHASCFGPALFF
jgi:hypothetical protein